MTIRTFAATALAAASLALPAPAPPPPAKVAPVDRPAITFQVRSVNHVLDDIRAGIKYTCGPLGNSFIDRFNRNFESAIGKEGFDGIDAAKPAGGYLTFGDTPEETQVFLVVPAPDEKKAVAMVNHSEFKLEPVAGNPGLYKIEFSQGPAPIPIRARVHDGYAYLGINVLDAGMDPRVLASSTKIFDPSETASLVVRAQPGKVPAKLYQAIRDPLTQSLQRDKDRAKRQNIEPLIEFFSGFESLAFKGLAHLEQNTDTITWRLNFDRKTGTFTDEEKIVPKPGTAFANEIANWGTTTNRFAGFADDSAAAWGVSKVPVFNEDVRRMLTGLLGTFETLYPKELPEQGHALAREVLALGKRTITKGEGDLAAALHGPDKDGLFTLSLALVADDPPAVEKELKALANNLPMKDIFTFDVAKVGDVALHEAKVGAMLPPEIQKVFGKDAIVCLGVGKDALYAAFGPDARPKVTKAAALKPAPAAAFDTRYNPAKIAAFAKAIDEKAGGHFANGLGPDDKLVPFWSATITGGNELTLKQTSNILTPYRVMFFVMEELFR